MSQNGKLMPNLDQQSTKVLNLTVLQRIDPFVEEILITAAHVTFYEFNIDLSQWSRKDVEGSLFVVKRNTQPRFQFIVMNRRNTDNLVENLLEDFEYEVQGPYLLYRNAAQEDTKCICQGASKVKGIFSKKAAMTITNASNATMTGPPYQTSPVILPSRPPSVPMAVPTIQVPAAPKSASTSLMPLLDTPEISNNGNQPTNLVKPSSFFSPPSSSALVVPSVSASMPSVPPLNHSGSLQRPYGAPLLQPFPPPTPPPSLTPTSIPTPNYPVISRDKVRDALLVLVQDNEFIDMVYRVLLNAHHS